MPWRSQDCARGSAAAAALLGFALVLLGGGLVVPQALEIGEDAGLGHLPLEAAQGGFDPFVFADRDLGHETLRKRKQPTILATDLQRMVDGTGRGAERGLRPAGGTAPEPTPGELFTEAGAMADEGTGLTEGSVEGEAGADPGIWDIAGQLSR